MKQILRVCARWSGVSLAVCALALPSSARGQTTAVRRGGGTDSIAKALVLSAEHVQGKFTTVSLRRVRGRERWLIDTTQLSRSLAASGSGSTVGSVLQAFARKPRAASRASMRACFRSQRCPDDAFGLLLEIGAVAPGSTARSLAIPVTVSWATDVPGGPPGFVHVRVHLKREANGWKVDHLDQVRGY